MKNQNKIEKIKIILKNYLYNIIKPIYLYSIGYKTLDEYFKEIIIRECIYTSDLSISAIQEYIEHCGDLLTLDNKLKLIKIVDALRK